MTDTPDFVRYSGPYYRSIEYIVRIGNRFEEITCKDILNKYNLDLGIIKPLDANGKRELYKDSVYYIFPIGYEPQQDQIARFFTLTEIGRLCNALEDGRITLPDFFGDQTGEDTEPDGGDDQSDTGSGDQSAGDQPSTETGEEQPGEDQEQGAADQP